MTTPKDIAEIEDVTVELRNLERQAERVVTIREAFKYGFKAGLSEAGLTSSPDRSYEKWLWSRS